MIKWQEIIISRIKTKTESRTYRRSILIGREGAGEGSFVRISASYSRLLCNGFERICHLFFHLFRKRKQHKRREEEKA
jgi:hypothetical protein